MSANVSQIAEYIRTSLGQAWWDAQVAVTIQNAHSAIVLGVIAILVAFAILIGSIVGFRRADRDRDVWAFAPMLVWIPTLGVGLAVVFGSLEILASPDLHVWQNLVHDVSRLLS